MQNESTSNSRDSVRAMVRVMGFAALVKAMMISGVMATSQAGAAIDPDSRQPAAAVQPSTSTWAADAAVLRDKTAAPAARSAACRQLLASRDAGARQFLVQLLTPVSEDQEARDVLVREVGQMASGPEWALAPMVELLAAAPVEKRAELLRCMSSIRTREAIRAILNSAKTSTLPEIREAAFTSLRRLTGRDELGSDETRWSDWFAGVEWLPEPEWRRVLAEGLAQYTQSMKSQRDLLLARLLDSERRRCLDAPTEPDRWNILASFLKDDLPALRKLGVELTNRELANARQPGAGVAQAALGLLSDTSPELRISGAELIDRLQPDEAGLAVSEALLKERDTRVLPLLLRQVERWPTAAARPIVLTLIDDPAPVGPAAVRALAALLEAGLLTQDDDRARILSVLRAVNIRMLDAPSLRLLCDHGNDEDRRGAGMMLEDPVAERRQNAALALSHRPGWLDQIVSAAQKDAGLFNVASSMIAEFRATPDGFTLLSRLPAVSPDGLPAPGRVRASLLALADKFTSAELVTVAGRITDLDLRESILNRLTSMPLGTSTIMFPGPRDSQPGVVVAGLLLLAQTRLEAHKPAAALTLLDSLDSPGVSVDERVVSSLRAQALIGLNRLADAIELDASPAAWITALGEVIDLPHASSVLAVIDANFRGELSQAEERAIDEVRTLIAERYQETPSAPDESRPKRTLPGPIR